MDKIVYIDGALASQMGAYAFYFYLDTLGLEPKMDRWWYRSDAGMGLYKLESIFGIRIREYDAPLKYRIYRSKNNVFRVIRKIGLLKLLVDIGIVPKQYYTLKPPYAGKMFDLYNIDKELLRKDRETYFWGYWQFWAPYIEKNLEALRDRFTFPEYCEEKNIETADIINRTSSVCMHIRRGDFLKFSDTFVVLSENYYKNAVNCIKENVENAMFFIFSNDIEWCRENLSKFNLEEDTVVFVDWNYGEKDFRDMQLMIDCKHYILANSGFSSWAAILNNNENKVVVAPNAHYKESFKRKSQIKDPYCPDNWIRVDDN